MADLALVTGASSGIGKAYADRLASDGHNLIVVGRRRDRMEDLAAALPAVDVQVVVCDLATDDGIDALARLTAERPVTMLVNASMAALELGEVVCAPGVQDYHLLQQVSEADLEAFQGPSPQLASRYMK